VKIRFVLGEIDEHNGSRSERFIPEAYTRVYKVLCGLEKKIRKAEEQK